MTTFNYFNIIFMIGWVLVWLIQLPAILKAMKAKGQPFSSLTGDSFLAILAFIGTSVLPLIYIFSAVFDFADYYLPDVLGWSGAAIFIPALWLLHKAHQDLGKNFSTQLEIKPRHYLVTTGIYSCILHPMYASGWLITLAQAALLHNWLAGLAGLILMQPFYWFRVNREEKMMLEKFGEDYRSYLDATGRVLPFRR